MEGVVDQRGVPVIDIFLGGRSSVANHDTGFNGDLELPDALRALLNPRFAGRADSFLAGGVSVTEDHFRVSFPFDGSVVSAVATFVPGDGILIGMRLLQPYRLTVDFPESRVWLQRD